MDGKKRYVLHGTGVLLIVFLLAQAALGWAAQIDDVFDAVFENAFRKAGKTVDKLDLLKKGDSFGDILRKNDDFADLLKKGKRLPEVDAGTIQKKIGFPSGSKYVDELMSLTKQERLIAYALDDVVYRMALKPNGKEVIQRLGKKGVLLGSVYGDDVVLKIYDIARQDELWDMARKSLVVVGQENAGLVEFVRKQNMAGGYAALKRVSDFDPIEFSARVVKKYGPQGMESVKKFLVKVGRYAKENPRKTVAELLLRVVYVDETIILDPLGRLKDKAVDGLIAGIVEITAETVASTVSVPMIMGTAFTEKLFPGMPLILKEIISYISAVLFIFAILYIVPPTRFIPRSIF